MATQAELTKWFMELRNPIRRWLATRSSVPTADLDDLAQEVFLRLLRYSDDVVVENPHRYLFRIAANVANEWRERSRNRLPHEESWLKDLEEDPDRDLFRLLEREETATELYAAIEQLPERQQYVLLEHALGELTYQQIADKMGLTHRTVLRDLTRAYAGIRLILGVAQPANRHSRQVRKIV